MAIKARRVGHADLGVGITGVAGPDPSEGKPVGTVYIALADDKRTWVKQITAGAAPGDRESGTLAGHLHALDLVRRYLEALPSVMAGRGDQSKNPPSGQGGGYPAGGGTPQTAVMDGTVPTPGGTDGPRICRRWGCGRPFCCWQPPRRWRCRPFCWRPKAAARCMTICGICITPPPPVSRGTAEIFPADMLSQFYSLYTLNDAVRGWVRIDGTNIDYPVVQGLDNVYYRNHSFNKNFSEYGTPFFSSSVSFTGAAVESRSMTIFGNNTDEILQEDDGQMFSQLTLYAASDMEFFEGPSGH